MTVSVSFSRETEPAGDGWVDTKRLVIRIGSYDCGVQEVPPSPSASCRRRKATGGRWSEKQVLRQEKWTSQLKQGRGGGHLPSSAFAFPWGHQPIALAVPPALLMAVFRLPDQMPVSSEVPRNNGLPVMLRWLWLCPLGLGQLLGLLAHRHQRRHPRARW